MIHQKGKEMKTDNKTRQTKNCENQSILTEDEGADASVCQLYAALCRKRFAYYSLSSINCWLLYEGEYIYYCQL